VSVAPALTSIIQASGPRNMGPLSLGAGSTLRVTDGNVAFAGSTLGTNGATYNLDTTFDINLGAVTGSGIINKTSGGSATVETANLAGPGAGSVFNINGGTLNAVGQNGQTNPLGVATVNLANGAGLMLSSRNGDVTYDNAVNATGTVRIGATPTGSGVPGVFTMSLGGTNALNLAPSTTVIISRTDNNRLRLVNTVLNGDATIQNTSTNLAGTILNVNSTGAAAGNTLNFTGTTRTRIAGTINAGHVVINNASGSAGGANTGGGVYSEPESGTTTVNAPAKIISQLDSNFGTLTFGSNILTGQKMVVAPGLRESWDNGGFQENGFTPHDQTITLGMPHANMPSINTDPGPSQGWANNRTYIYQGQFFVSDNDVPGDRLGNISFAEQFDDNVLIRVDGVQVDGVKRYPAGLRS